jgi:hypothetical protein
MAIGKCERAREEMEAKEPATVARELNEKENFAVTL